MKQLLTGLLVVALAALILTPLQVLAATDTLTVYASTGVLDATVRGDTLSNGSQAHHVYKLVSTDTTYIFDATMTFNTSITFLGVPKTGTGKLPCIQPDVLSNNTVPGVFFTFTGQHSTVILKNLYLLGVAINNTVNYGGGQGVQITADSVTYITDNVVYEQLSQFAIGYAGKWCKFFITNCKFRNMTTQPNQYYVGELLRNENYVAAFPTDTIIIRYCTMLCVSGYATAATGGITHYYDFTHNNVVYTFKNPFFLDRSTNARFDNNIFYGAYAGGENAAEFTGWDSFTGNTGPSIITMGLLDSTTAALLLGHASTGAGDPAAEALRKVEVKNNVYFWPSALTAYWTAWNDTAHTDTIYTPTFMNPPTVAMFANKTAWPGFVESGNQNVDPSFGASIPGVLNAGTDNGVGLLAWFAAVRSGKGTTELYGYNITQIPQPEPADYTPTWPLLEAADMQYGNAVLKTAATDGSVIGDPNWWGIVLAVKDKPTGVPASFSLSQNYPNPFNPSTKIDFSIPAGSLVQLKVYNVLGQEVATLVNETMKSGSHTVTFDASKLASGVYLYKITAGSFVSTRKMVLLK